MLPMNLLLFDVAKAIEETASQAGLLMMKTLIEEEVEQIVGPCYRHQSDREAMRWGQDEGHVMFAGRKTAMAKPRVRTVDGHEVPLSCYQAFTHSRRMQQTVSKQILRRVSMRHYAGAIDDVCDG